MKIENFLENKTKRNLISFFLQNGERNYSLKELKSFVSGKNLSKDLILLAKEDFIKVFIKKGLSYYRFNKKLLIDPKLKVEIIKSTRKFEDDLLKSIRKNSTLKAAVLSGIFVSQKKLDCDLLLVGEIGTRSLNAIITKAEKLLGQEINYVLMNLKDFEFRKNIFDRFIKDVFENEHVQVVNKIKS